MSGTASGLICGCARLPTALDWLRGLPVEHESAQGSVCLWSAQRASLGGEVASIACLVSSLPYHSVPCRVDADDRSGEYSCIFLPEPVGRGNINVEGNGGGAEVVVVKARGRCWS